MGAAFGDKGSSTYQLFFHWFCNEHFIFYLLLFVLLVFHWFCKRKKTVLISFPCVLIGCYWLFIGFVRTTMDLICCSLVRICVCPQALVFFINGWCVLPNISVPIYMRRELWNRCWLIFNQNLNKKSVRMERGALQHNLIDVHLVSESEIDTEGEGISEFDFDWLRS